MSANRTKVKTNETHKTFEYVNSIRIPNYLIALAIGDLEFRALDHRTGVITEPCKIEEVAKELEDLPTYLNTAE